MRAAPLFLSLAALATLGSLAFLLAPGALTRSPEKTALPELRNAAAGSSVQISGEVKSAYFRDGNMFISICAGECVRAVMFKATVAELSAGSPGALLARKGDHVTATGEVSEYKGEKSLVLESLEIVR